MATSPPKSPLEPALKSPSKSPKSPSKSPKTRTPSPPDGSPPAETGLQPGSHWTEQALPEIDDEDADSTLGSDAASSTASISSSILQYRMLNGRTYHSDRTANQYWGANDETQNNSVDIMHHALTLALDDKLYLAPLPDHLDKVLDVGTGTGIWAIDFADEHPDAQVIGTDLSPIQPAWVPPNVTFQIDDFSEPWTFPPNSFDYIHLRWLVGSVTDWNKLFAEAYRALKPGGWIESIDFDGEYQSEDDTLNKTALAQWGYIFREGIKKLGSSASFMPVTEGLQRKAIEANGFVGLVETKVRFPLSEWAADPRQKEVGQFVRASLSNDIEGTVGLMATQLGWSKTEISVYAAHVRHEMKSLKVHAYCVGNVAYAQKPLDA